MRKRASCSQAFKLPGYSVLATFRSRASKYFGIVPALLISFGPQPLPLSLEASGYEDAMATGWKITLITTPSIPPRDLSTTQPTTARATTSGFRRVLKSIPTTTASATTMRSTGTPSRPRVPTRFRIATRNMTPRPVSMSGERVPTPQ